jgi:hypothetical protein
MLYQTLHRILHIVYTDKDKTSNEFQTLNQIANRYEGNISSRIGFNFPMNIVEKSNMLRKYDVDYIIVYKKGDVLTKKHEIRHAMYFLDKEYRLSIQKLWSSLTSSSQLSIISILLKMKYPNDMKILLDEFQAYYYTEKKGFFGKINFL